MLLALSFIYLSCAGMPQKSGGSLTLPLYRLVDPDHQRVLLRVKYFSKKKKKKKKKGARYRLILVAGSWHFRIRVFRPTHLVRLEKLENNTVQ